MAVLAVLAYHSIPAVLPGGFVGVDVFFVISGYLISSILIRDLDQGRFSIPAFYGRRIKRIFPALVAVLTFMFAVGWLLQFSFEFKNLGEHISGGVAFMANFKLLYDTGYFAAVQDRQPLLHLWSLGVEEQFYIVFPLILWALSRLANLKNVILTVLLGASFIHSLSWSSVFPDAAFFLPYTRGWELLMGCVLASLENGRGSIFAEWAQSRETRANGLSALGMLLIATGAVCVNSCRPYPGLWALMPTLGAVCVILAGPQSWCNRHLLGCKIMVGIGLISYPLYLWHWPLLYTARILFSGHVPAWGMAVAIGAAFGLAFLTFRYIERPIRFGGGSAASKVIALCSAMLALFALGQLAYNQTITPRLASYPLDREVSAAAVDRYYPYLDNLLPVNLSFDAQINTNAAGSTVLFIGDSHLQQYWPRIKWNLVNAPDKCRPLAFITCSGAPALPNVNRTAPGQICDKFFNFAVRQAAQPKVGTVVFGCFWESYFKGSFPDVPPAQLYRVDDPARTPLVLGSPATEQVFAEFGQVIRKLVDMGKEVVVITSSPASTQWNPRLAPRFGEHELAAKSPVSRKDFEGFVAPVTRLVTNSVLSNGGKIIDPLDYFAEDGCFRGITPDGRFRYKDGHHLRPFYVTENAVFIDHLVRSDGSNGR